MKKALVKSGLLAMISLAFLGVTLGTVSWFTSLVVIDNTYNTNTKIDGSTMGAYFAYGNGIPTGEGNRVYGINKPRHLYNLAWLQYLGFFDKADGTQYYFEIDPNLEGELDMTGWTLPPIGTEDHPFIGNFNGNGKIVANLNISNNFTDYNTHPSDISGWNNTTYKQPHIVGMFGVIGNYNNKYDTSSSTVVYDTSANEFKNTGLTGITVKTAVQDSLIGLAAGYVDGEMSNIAVDTGTVDIASDVSLSGATTAYAGFDNISDYTLVGHTTKTTSIKKVTDTIYDVAVQTGQEFNANAQGASTQGWGGSIDMKSMFQRLNNIRQNATASSTTYAYRTIKTYNPNGSQSGSDDNSSVSTGNYGKMFFPTGANATVGGFNMLNCSYNQSNNYMYLGGGKININNHYSYVQSVSAKISDGKGHYLKGVPSTDSTYSTNAGSVTNDTSNNATYWQMTDGESVYLYANMKYQENSTAIDYYLSVNGTTVRLTTNASYRTSFTKEVVTEGNTEKIRYSYDGMYLTYEDSAWKMVDLPTEPSEPTPPTGSKPTPPAQPDYDSYMSGGYQIYYTLNSQPYYMGTNGSNATANNALSPSNTYGWKLESTSSVSDISFGNNVTGYLYTYYNSTKYYLRDSGNNNPWQLRVTTSKSTADSVTLTKSNNTYRIKIGSTYACLFNSNSVVYSSRSSGKNNCYYDLSIVLTRTILEDAYNTAYSQYQSDLATYNATQSAYEAAVAAYPAQVQAYQAKLAASFSVVLVDKVSTDTSDTYLDDSKKTVSYDYNATNTTYYPLNVKEDGGTSSSSITNGNYRPTDGNTGYVIAGSQLEETNTVNNSASSIRVSKYGYSDIENSYSNGKIADSDVRTINGDGDQPITSVYSDLEKDLEKYSSSKTTLLSVLNGDSGSNIYGLHFMNTKISMEHILKASNVSILGTSYGNPNDSATNKRTYDLPVNSIDFNLKEKGYINFFAGTYYSSDVTSFFSLHQVFRDSEANGYAITDIKEIAEIYGNNDHKNWSYAYKYTDGTYSKPYRFTGVNDKYELTTATPDPNTPYVEAYDLSSSDFNTYTSTFGYTKLFDTQWITNYTHSNSTAIHNLLQNYLYYFEIPMNSGEFCLGSVYGGTGGYLLYLDIGASAAKTQRTVFAEHFFEEICTFSYPNGVALIPTETIEGNSPTFDEKNSACVVIKATYQGILTVSRDDSDNVQIARDADYTDVAKPSYISDTIVSVVDPGADSGTSDDVDLSSSFEYESKLEKETYRIQYLDFHVNFESLTRTIIEDVRTKENDAASWSGFTRTITQQVDNGDILTLTSETQITNGTIAIFKYLGLNNANNGTKWTYSEINNLSSTIYFNGSTNVTVSAICSTLTSELIVLYSTPEGEASSTNTIILEIKQDELLTNGTYYMYDQYVFIPVVSGDDIDFMVKNVSTKEVYFVDGNAVLENGKFVYVLANDGTLLNTEGQVVTATKP